MPPSARWPRSGGASASTPSPPPPASIAWSTRAWPTRSGSSRSSAVTTRGSSRWWFSAAPAPCTAPRSPRTWGWPRCSCPKRPASSPPSGCSPPRSSTTTRARCRRARTSPTSPPSTAASASSTPLEPARVPAAVAAFHAVHERVYGYARAQQPVEFVNFRAVHTYPLPRPAVTPAARATATLDDARLGERRAYFGGFVPTVIYERARLPVGARLAGPAIVEQNDTTTVIPPGVTALVDDAGNLRLRRV